MKFHFFAVLALFVAAIFPLACGNNSPTSSNATSTPLVTNTVTHTPTLGNTATSTATNSQTASATLTNTATQTMTITLTATPVSPTLPIVPSQTAYTGLTYTYNGFPTTDSLGNSLSYTTTTILPTGLSLNPAGVLTGTMTSTGTYSITVTATDNVTTKTASASFNLTVNPLFTDSTISSQTDYVGKAITPFDSSTHFTDNAGDTLTYSGGSLPTGLSINPSTGVISGTPTGSPGISTITVTATDPLATGAAGNISETFGINVEQLITSSVISTQTDTIGTAITPIVSSNYFTDNAGDTLTYSTVTLPPGLAMNSAGVLSGTPTGSTGTYSITVTATDAVAGQSVSDTFNLNIN